MPKSKTLILLIATVLTVSCGQGHAHRDGAPVFTDEVRLPMTPVKDQGRSSLCWVYAMLATIESEHIGQGDSVNLSADYVARQWISRLTRECFFSGGAREVSLRGMMTMLPPLISKDGLMAYDAYHGDGTDYDALCRRMTRLAATAPTLRILESRMSSVLDEHIGAAPQRVYMLGAEYTPEEFAHSVCRRGEYTALTSFTHHPFGERFVLEVPDNRMGDSFLNVPIDTLVRLVTSSLRAGHPVCWEGDISERGFDFFRGTATLPHGRTTQAARQRAFERRLTTDDHCMALVGIAHDRRGHRFFIAKNSWGTDNPYGGLMYLSEDYLRMKTIAVMLKTPDTP